MIEIGLIALLGMAIIAVGMEIFTKLEITIF